MTTHARTLGRRLVPLCAAAAILWTMTPAFGMAGDTLASPHEPTSMLLLGGALIGFAATVRRKSLPR